MNGDTSRISSRKRIRKEIGKFGRNIKQKLLCGFFVKEGIHFQDESIGSDLRTSSDVESLKGFGKLAYNSFPNSHESPKLEL